MKKTLACIISYNGRTFLPECINSCLHSDMDILVIDNNSRDGSLEYLSSLNTLDLINNEENLGFTKAVNRAIEYALNNNYEYLLLLNQDTEFETEMVSLLQKSFKENPSLAIVSPLQLNEQNRPEYQFQLNCNDLGINIITEERKTIEVSFVNAACWLMDLQKVRKIGLLNPIFKNYGSDVNYCNRAIKLGYKVGINLEASIIHKKKDKDYENNFLKTIKVHNTCYLALILNPIDSVSVKSILTSLAKGAIGFLLKLRFKKSLLNALTFGFLILKLSEIKELRLIDAKNSLS